MSDLINPFLGFRMSQGWLNGSHKKNPAMDYATPIGTRFGAPGAGVYRHLSSNLSRTDPTAAGHMGELLLVGGRWNQHRIRFAHLDEHLAGDGGRVAQLDVLAETGNTGFVVPRPTAANPNLGAHVHTYGLTPARVRWNWTLYADAAPATPADSGSQPFDPSEEDDMNATESFMLEAIFRALVRDAGGGQFFMTDHLAQRLGSLEPVVAETYARVRGGDPRGDMLQIILEKLGQPISADVDEAALARELLPLLTVHMSSLSNEDVDRISRAAADEKDRRDRERLAS